MIDTIFNVLDQDTESTAGVLREVAGLFDDDEKSRNVLEAVNAFRLTVRTERPPYFCRKDSSLTGSNASSSLLWLHLPVSVPTMPASPAVPSSTPSGRHNHTAEAAAVKTYGTASKRPPPTSLSIDQQPPLESMAALCRAPQGSDLLRALDPV